MQLHTMSHHGMMTRLSCETPSQSIDIQPLTLNSSMSIRKQLLSIGIDALQEGVEIAVLQ